MVYMNTRTLRSKTRVHMLGFGRLRLVASMNTEGGGIGSERL